MQAQPDSALDNARRLAHYANTPSASSSSSPSLARSDENTLQDGGLDLSREKPEQIHLVPMTVPPMNLKTPDQILNFNKHSPYGVVGKASLAKGLEADEDMLLDSCRVLEEERPARRDAVESREMFAQNRVMARY